MTALPTWSEQIRKLEGVSEDLIAAWRLNGATESEVQDMNKLVLSILASGYLCRVYTNESRPVFMPLWNYAFNQGGPNPDYVYASTEIDSGGVYEISGLWGTSRLVEITQQGWDMFGIREPNPGPPLQGTNELDELAIAEIALRHQLLLTYRSCVPNVPCWAKPDHHIAEYRDGLQRQVERPAMCYLSAKGVLRLADRPGACSPVLH